MGLSCWDEDDRDKWNRWLGLAGWWGWSSHKLNISVAKQLHSLAIYSPFTGFLREEFVYLK